MEQRKLHTSPWPLLALAALLIVGVLLASAGIAFARYRTDAQWEYQFQVKAGSTLVLGAVDANGDFQPQQHQWQQTDGAMRLDFAVANGTSEEDRSQLDQTLCLRLLGSPDAWDEAQPPAVTLQVGETVYTASASQIREGSALYMSFGDGWVFSFLDEEGEELTWDLSGDSFACLQMTLTADIVDTAPGLLQLQLIGQTK